MDVKELNLEFIETTNYSESSSTPVRRWEIRNQYGIKCGVIFDRETAEKLGAKPLIKTRKR